MKKSLKTVGIISGFLTMFLLPLLVVGCNNQIIEQNQEERVTPVIQPKNLPYSIKSIELKVSAEDMETVTRTIQPDDTSFSIELERGEARTFELTVENPSVTFTGSTTVDLTGDGESMDVTIPLELSSVKLVIPDPDIQGANSLSRIVQIDNLGADGWIQKDFGDFGFSDFSYFEPSDIDFDTKGRVYIVNSFDNTIIRIHHINDLSSKKTISITTGGSPITCMTIDHNNDWIYVGTFDGQVIRCDYEGNNVTNYGYITNPMFNGDHSINGLCTDDEGYGYVAYWNSYDFTGKVAKYNPVTGQLLSEHSFGSDQHPGDVLYKNSYIYVTVTDTISYNHRVVQLNTDMQPLDSLTEKPGGGDNFLGPKTFLAIPGKKIILIDAGTSSGDNNNRLVGFDSIDGSGWETFSAGDIGETSFSFFESGAFN